MLKSQDIVVALGVLVATVVILFGTSGLSGDQGSVPRRDSTAIRPASPVPEDRPDEPEASPSEVRADSLPIVRVALPVTSSR